jgi:hypothetical protein
MTRVSGGDSADGQWWEASTGPAIDATGAIMAFSSRHPIDASGIAADYNLFIRLMRRT